MPLSVPDTPLQRRARLSTTVPVVAGNIELRVRPIGPRVEAVGSRQTGPSAPLATILLVVARACYQHFDPSADTDGRGFKRCAVGHLDRGGVAVEADRALKASGRPLSESFESGPSLR